MMTCQRCNQPSAPGDDACRFCGLAVGAAASESVPPQWAAPNAWGAPPQAGMPYGQPAPHQAASPYGQAAPPHGAAPYGPPAPPQGWGAPGPGAHGHGAHGQYAQGPPPGAMGPWYGPTPTPQNEWPVARGVAIAIGIFAPLLLIIILWAMWREKYPLAASTVVNTFLVKVGVVFVGVLLLSFLSAFL